MRRLMVCSLILLLAAASVHAQDAADKKTPPTADKPDRAALEKAFAERMTGVVLTGKFSQVTPDGLSEGSTDKYTIESCRKIKANVWEFRARVQYGERDVTVPIFLDVRWAGSTPVITLDEQAIPGLGTYSARVLVDRDLYSGTWFAAGHYGVLSGRISKIEKNEDDKADTNDKSESRSEE